MIFFDTLTNIFLNSFANVEYYFFFNQEIFSKKITSEGSISRCFIDFLRLYKNTIVFNVKNTNDSLINYKINKYFQDYD